MTMTDATARDHGYTGNGLGFCSVCGAPPDVAPYHLGHPAAPPAPQYVLAQQAQLDRIERKLDEFAALLDRFRPLLETAEKRLKRAPAMLGGLKGGKNAR